MASCVTERFDDRGRLIARWWPLQWTTPLTTGQPQPISIFDILELRGVVDTNRIAAGLDPVSWVGRTDDDPTFVAGLTPIRAIHFNQLRLAMGDLWEFAGLGLIPVFRAGPILPGARVISVRDPLDLRSWVETFELARPDLAARVAWRYLPTASPFLPLLKDAPARDRIEVWDATGHAIFSVDPISRRWTERRRVDTHWHRIDLEQSSQDGVRPDVLVTPEPRLTTDGFTASSPAEGTPFIVQPFGIPPMTWPSALPFPLAEWTAEMDPLGRIVRWFDGDNLVGRLAYDGFGRPRKFVGTDTWHILGPNVAVRVDAIPENNTPAPAG